MKKITLILLSLFFITTAACDKKASSNWADTPIAIDGSAKEWSSYPLLSFDKQQMTVGISNSDSELYLMFAFADPGLVRLFTMNGMTVWLGKDGEKNKNIGMTLVPFRMPENMRGQRQTEMEIPEEMRQMIPRKEPGMHFIMMGEPDDPTGENLPVAEARMVNARYCIEFRIPINRDSSRPYAVDIKKDGSVDLGFEIVRPEFDRSKMRSGGNMGGNMGGMGRGGMRGGGMRPGGSGGRGMQMPNELKLWMNVNLAEKQ